MARETIAAAKYLLEAAAKRELSKIEVSTIPEFLCLAT
jgi:hypothetical protein